MRRRVLLIAILITALALAVPTAAIYFAAFTQSGLQFIVNASTRAHRRRAPEVR